MTERDVFMQNIPVIAEMIVEARKLTAGEFEAWREETMEQTPEKAKPFVQKIFVTITNNL